MKIKNNTKKTVLSDDAKFCVSLADQFFGLLSPHNPRTLVFKTRFGIHTFFLKESIDVILLDNDKKVVEIKEGFPSNRIYVWNPKYALVIELPAGSVGKSKTVVGDMLEVKG